METKKLQLLVTSDIHGYLMPTTYRRTLEPLGLVKLASIIEELRGQTPSLLIDNGDLIQGSPLASYYHANHSHRPNPIIEIANFLNYDVAIFGNHEFNYGLPFLKKAVTQSQFPWLSGNIFHEDGTAFTQPYIVKELDGIRIGIIGVTTHFVPVWEESAHIEDLDFHDAFESAKRWITHIRQHEQVDVVVLCYHGGFSHDLSSGELLEPNTGENQGYLMCKELECDIVITGHQHREIATKAFAKSIVQPGTKGNCLAAITIELDIENGQIINKHHEATLHYVEEDTPACPQVISLLEAIHQQTENWLDEPLGTIEGNMLFENAFHVRVYKHPYIEFIQNVQMAMTNTSISCTALFHDGPGGFPKDVTRRHIVTNYIFPNTLKVLRVKGKQIVQALEQNASYFSLKDGDLTISKSFLYPKAQPYNYDMWEGINYTLDIRRPIGERVTEVTFQGEPLNLQASYDVVMNNYRATGAGNFPYFADCPIIKDVQTDMTELITRYFEEHPIIQATQHQNWKILF
ncbi:bifunctional metallophosphatase/5'-nucleotidase [Lysinibacillus sphaericus]|uniref:2',3'-cyclic-nucleotide n=1 Tax=Lysinibacillus sphaericus OT4b.31 TaxID=1285586 RepID=R7Z8I2_LYSSH|nr:bifunctional UDP-sugar hydrolase/5'-nucleotidase [Lysinibacillus sphaericus]EON70334.1 2',3'-cyclic-nucleotide [Lysinibacillus sphaericus OT4b.31]